MTRVRWTRPSRDDLRRIDAWLTQEASPDIAERTLASIRFRAGFLADFPRGGRPFRGDTRILRVSDTPYLLLYRLVGDIELEILRVYHERQDWMVKI